MRAVPFVILCLARTGSSHLVDLLDSHPEIRCYGEVLNRKHRGATEEGWIGDSDAPDAVSHLGGLLAGPGVIGCKLPLNSLRDHPEVGSWIAGKSGVRVIRLRRANALSLLLSRKLLRATLVSQSIYGSYGAQRVRIEPSECLRALKRIEAEDAELDALARGHEAFDLDYESLNDASALNAVQEFLGVPPRQLSSRYARLRTRSFSETIENWRELSEALAKTRYAHLLDEDPA